MFESAPCEAPKYYGLTAIGIRRVCSVRFHVAISNLQKWLFVSCLKKKATIWKWNNTELCAPHWHKSCCFLQTVSIPFIVIKISITMRICFLLKQFDGFLRDTTKSQFKAAPFVVSVNFLSVIYFLVEKLPFYWPARTIFEHLIKVPTLHKGRPLKGMTQQIRYYQKLLGEIF